MGEVIQKFFIAALAGALFLAIFALAFEFTDIIPQQHAETLYFVFMAPWMIWGVFYFGIPLIRLLFKMVGRGS